MANSVDPDEMPHLAASHLGLYSLLRPVCLNTYGNYSVHFQVLRHSSVMSDIKMSAKLNTWHMHLQFYYDV